MDSVGGSTLDPLSSSIRNPSVYRAKTLGTVGQYSPMLKPTTKHTQIGPLSQSMPSSPSINCSDPGSLSEAIKSLRVTELNLSTAVKTSTLFEPSHPTFEEDSGRGSADSFMTGLSSSSTSTASTDWTSLYVLDPNNYKSSNIGEPITSTFVDNSWI